MIDRETLRKSARRALRLRFELGLFDAPESSPFADWGEEEIDSAAHRALALESASKALVLLRNDDSLLPLSPGNLRSVAVIGPNANRTEALLSDYNGCPGLEMWPSPNSNGSQYINGHDPSPPCHLVTPLQGLEQALRSKGVGVTYDSGCPLSGAVNASEVASAATSATAADLAVVVLGLVSGDGNAAKLEGEAHDRSKLGLPEAQMHLLGAVLAAQPKTILVVVSGSAISEPSVMSPDGSGDRSPPVIVQQFYPGSLGGTALARALLGESCFSGRLPVTAVSSVADLPPYLTQELSAAPYGRTHRYLTAPPLYPFGFGINSHPVTYTGLRVSPSSFSTRATNISVAVNVSCVSDTTTPTQDEVVQVYVAYHKDRSGKTLQPCFRCQPGTPGVERQQGHSSIPLHELKAFARVSVPCKAAGGGKQVTLSVAASDLELVGPGGEMELLEGTYVVHVGGTNPRTPPRLLRGDVSQTARGAPGRPLQGTFSFRAKDDAHHQPPPYWCTWATQGRLMFDTAPTNLTKQEADKWWMSWRAPGSKLAWSDYLNESTLFANVSRGSHGERTGMAYTWPRNVRSRLVLMLDMEWAWVNNRSNIQAQPLRLDTIDRFPSFAAPTPTLALQKLVQKVKEAGWLGLGVWSDWLGPPVHAAANLKMLHAAGVAMLKYDAQDAGATITSLARSVAPGLWVTQHGKNQACEPLSSCPSDGAPDRYPIANAQADALTLNRSDVFTTYDFVYALSVPEALDRHWKILSLSSLHRGDAYSRLIGSSGVSIVTGALGGLLEPMDSNVRGLELPSAFDTYIEGPAPRRRQHREDELSRLVLWATIATPFGAGANSGGIKASEEILYDEWEFSLCDDACVVPLNLTNRTVRSGAPARISRGGLPLPGVSRGLTSFEPAHRKPFVVLTKFPNRSELTALVTTLGRTSLTGWTEDAADIQITLQPALFGKTATLGVIGHMSSLSVTLGNNLPAPRVCAKDMLDIGTQQCSDITSNTTWRNGVPGTLTVPGTLLRSLGTAKRSRADDVSSPGTVLYISWQ